MKQVLESTAIELRAKVTVLEAKVEQQDSLLTSFLREKNERTAAAATDYVPISNNQSAVCHPGTPVFMRGSQNDWPHLERNLFRHGIGENGIRLLRLH